MRCASLAVLLVACGHPGPTGPTGPTGPGSAAPDPGSASTAGAAARPPVAERRVVTDTYHGVAVEDPYQWLEADDQAVTAWSDGQDAFARAALAKLPELDTLRAEVKAILAAPITTYGYLRTAKGVVFALRKDPAKEQPELIAIADLAHPEAATLVLDPTTRGTGIAIDWYVPSPDGTRIAVSLSAGGSEEGTLHVIGRDGVDVDTPIENVQRGTGGGDVAWTPDGKGFYYTRYPSPGEGHDDERDFWMEVWFHTLGAATDRYELGKGLPKIAEILLETDARGRVIASIQNGDGGTFRHYLRTPKATWRQLTDWTDGVAQVGFGPKEDLILISRAGAPHGKVLRLPAKATSLAAAKVLIPEGKDPIVTDFYDEWGVVATADRLYVAYQTGGPSEIRAFTLTGAAAKSPALPPVSAVYQPVPVPGGVLVYGESYTTPATWYRFTAATGALAPLAALSPAPPVDLSGFEVRRELATSKDGTKVPLNIVWPRGAKQDGSVKCLATGYGGYNAPETPHFLTSMAPLLSRGMCFVDVNLRGGSEFGEEWHAAGMLTAKQNVFDDFAAALAYLVDQGFTSRDRLAITGASNGGLLMGAMLTQHPDQMKAVVTLVGLYDMVRAERSANGQYNVPEYGSVADAAQFAALFAYSPYHHVVAGTKYPATLFMTGANDPRVPPWHSRKMVAAMQAAQAGDAPILLRTSRTSGHGSGTGLTERIEQVTLRAAFILDQLR